MSSHDDSFVDSGSSPTHPAKISPDFFVENHGSIFLLKPHTDLAISWVEEHIGSENGYQPNYPSAVVVEHRYIANIVAGIRNDGLTVQV